MADQLSDVLTACVKQMQHSEDGINRCLDKLSDEHRIPIAGLRSRTYFKLTGRCTLF